MYGTLLNKKFITALMFSFCLLFGCIIEVSANESASVIATVGISICGNRKIEGGEVCDIDSLENMSCSDFGYDMGDLKCSISCQEFDLTSCLNDSEKEVEAEKAGVENVLGDEREVKSEMVKNDNTLNNESSNSNIQSIYTFGVDLESVTISRDMDGQSLYIDVSKDIFSRTLPP